MTGTYITEQGDTFDKIAYEHCGRESLSVLLMAANPQHLGILVFPAGLELRLPPEPEESGTQNGFPPWRTEV